MGNEQAIRDVIARLDAAHEPDRELDAEIWLALHPDWLAYPRDDREGSVGWTTPKDGRAYLPYHYTDSIDDALTLVEPRVEYSISTLYGIADVELPLNDGGLSSTVRREDGSVPFALCVAALQYR